MRNLVSSCDYGIDIGVRELGNPGSSLFGIGDRFCTFGGHRFKSSRYKKRNDYGNDEENCNLDP